MSSMEVIQRAVPPALLVELLMALVTAGTPNPSVGEECQKANLDTTVGEDARILDL
jgi:hypothetical protein